MIYISSVKKKNNNPFPFKAEESDQGESFRFKDIIRNIVEPFEMVFIGEKKHIPFLQEREIRQILKKELVLSFSEKD